MRSRRNSRISSAEVHQWALQWFLSAKLLKDHGWLCTATVVWNIVLRAAARTISIFAACRDLANAPSQQAVFNALVDGLPKSLSTLEKRLNAALTESLPRRWRKARWQIAIDFHLTPYYGEPDVSPDEIYRSKPKDGTSNFHAYATVCIVQYGHRYTLALTWVRRHEPMVAVLQRLLAKCREIGVKIRRVLLDRAFFTAAVMAFLQEKELPFLMPVVFRGRKPKKRRARTGLHALKRKKAGRYPHHLQHGKQRVEISIFVSYRRYHHRKTGQRRQKKLFFASWRVHGSPTEIRERYRKRFGIESSFRQLRQARIRTCTRDPHLRLVFIAVALILRNFWVWIHAELLADGCGQTMTLRLDRLRFERLLDWIAQTVIAILHDGSMPCIEFE